MVTIAPVPALPSAPGSVDRGGGGLDPNIGYKTSRVCQLVDGAWAVRGPFCSD